MNKYVFVLGCLFFFSKGVVGQSLKPELEQGFKEVQSTLDYRSLRVPETELNNRIETNAKNKVLIFASPIKVHLDLNEIAVRFKTKSGECMFLALTAKDAKSLNLIFSSFSMDSGSYVQIFKPNLDEILGPFDFSYNPTGFFSSLATYPVSGDSIVVGFYVPNKEKSTCIIGQVNYDFVGITKNNGHFGLSGNCNIDVLCPQGDLWHKEKASVCKIIVGGVGLCTGTVINNTNEDGRDYILTAEHCFSIPFPEEQFNSAASNSIFIFNYESPWCNGPNGSENQNIIGSIIRSRWAATAGTDFALLELSNQIPTSFYTYYSGWSRQTSNPTSSTGIHHPKGDVKKICFENNPTSISGYPDPNTLCSSHSLGLNNLWRVNDWDDGTTEGGSSGSALFNPNHRIIGQLWGGCTGCTNNLPDYYGRLALSWLGNGSNASSLHFWLDPLVSSPLEFHGLRFIRFYTVDHDAWFTGDVVKFQNVDVLTGHDVVVTELQDRFEAIGTLDIPAGVTFSVEKP